MNKRKQSHKAIQQKQSPKPGTPASPFHFSGRKFHVIFSLAVIVSCFAIYGNNISNGFSLDDEFVLHNDTVVQKGISAIPELFKMRYAWDQKGSYGYRPVVTASYAVECQFFGSSPHTGHVINDLLFAFLVICLFYFLRKLFYNQVSDYFLFVVMAIFIAHPLHTEVVDSLKNRDVLLVNLFGLYACYAFMKVFETKGIIKQVLWVISGLLSYNLGLLSKLDEVLFLAIVPLVLFFYYKGKWKPLLLSILFMLIGSRGLLRFTRHELIPSHYHRTFIFIEQPLLHTHWYQRIPLGFYSLWFYTRKLIFPWQMTSYYGYDEVNPFAKWTDMGVIIGILLAAGLLYLIFKNRKQRSVLLFSLLLFAGSIFIYLNVLKVGPGIVAERFMFIPSIGFCLCVGILMFHFLKIPLANKPYGVKTQYLYLIAGAIVVIYSGRTIARNPDWKSHLSIYEHDAKSAPRSAKLQSLLASAYVQRIKSDNTLSRDQKIQYYKLAQAAYQASVDIYPDYSTSLNNLGMIQFSFYRDYEKAIQYFSKAVAIDSGYTEALFNLGAVYEAMNKKDSAETYYLKAIHSNPEYFLTYVYLARLYFNEGQLDKVLQFNQDALKKGYVSDVLYVNIGNVYLDRHDSAIAINYFEKAVACFNKNTYLEDLIANYYRKKGDIKKAEYYTEMADRVRMTHRANDIN